MQEITYNGVACYNAMVKLGRSPLSNKHKILILETNHQPDYYALANFPPNKHQSNWRLFLLIKKHLNCFQDLVLKKAYQINKELSTDIDIMPGQIKFQKEEYQCIRINLTNTNLLETIINKIESIGIKFISDKRVNEFETIVFFKRYTELVKIGENIYKDYKIPGQYYFPIENNIEFNEFINGIKKIKNNCNFHMFDSFQLFMFTKNGKGQDFIGIFSDHCDENRFPELKESIKKFF
jgi:hypothetical protein